jgi:hypothetical protein
MKFPLCCIALVAATMTAASAQPATSVTPAGPVTDSERAERNRLEVEKKKQLEARWNIRMDVLMVAVPQDLALPFIGEFQSDDDRKVEAAFVRIQEMILKKQAILLGWPSLVALDGQRVVMETIVEKRYPAEFSLATTPPKGGSKLVDHDLSSAMATSFETRNTGATLEGSASVYDDGRRILVEVVPQRVALIGSKTHKVEVKSGPMDVEQPEFATEKVTSVLSMRNGARILIAIHRLESPADHIEFFILHARASPLK